MARHLVLFLFVILAVSTASSESDATSTTEVASEAPLSEEVAGSTEEPGETTAPSSDSVPPVVLPQCPEVLVVVDVNNLLRSNPQLKATPLTRVATTRSNQIRYTAGARSSIDRLVGINSNSIYYGSLRDVELTVTYPRVGLGSVVTFVDIVVNQVDYIFYPSYNRNNTY